MALPEYGQKRISELELKNDINDADSFGYDNASTGNTFRIQFLGLVNKMLQNYVAGKDFSNEDESDLRALMGKLGQIKTPDDGTGLILRSHANETNAGLGNLSQQLVNATAHIITDKFAESLTTPEFQQLCNLLAGVVNRTSSGSADGLLALKDLSNITDDGYVKMTKIKRQTLTQSGSSIIVPENKLGFCLEVSLTANVSSIQLPTITDTTTLHQCLLIIKRNGYWISSDAFTRNGYVVRGDGVAMPEFSNSNPKDNGIEFFCEYDGFINTSSKTWNYGYSRIGH